MKRWERVALALLVLAAGCSGDRSEDERSQEAATVTEVRTVTMQGPTTHTAETVTDPGGVDAR
jgi:ABC-type Fe3+-hydroxamate transport system substrate-binding protein